MKKLFITCVFSFLLLFTVATAEATFVWVLAWETGTSFYVDDNGTITASSIEICVRSTVEVVDEPDESGGWAKAWLDFDGTIYTVTSYADYNDGWDEDLVEDTVTPNNTPKDWDAYVSGYTTDPGIYIEGLVKLTW